MVTKITVFKTSRGKGKRVPHQLISTYYDKSWGLGGGWVEVGWGGGGGLWCGGV